jgi:hypothetical protein
MANHALALANNLRHKVVAPVAHTPHGALLEQTQPENLPPEATITRFVSLLNAMAAEMTLPSAAMT